MSEQKKEKGTPVLDVLKSVWQEYCSEDAGSNGTEVAEDGMSQLLRDLNDGWSLVDAIDTIESLQQQLKASDRDKACMVDAMIEFIKDYEALTAPEKKEKDFSKIVNAAYRLLGMDNYEAFKKLVVQHQKEPL